MNGTSIFLLACWAIAFWPVWKWYGLRLGDSPEDAWSLLALTTAGYFLWLNRGRAGKQRIVLSTILILMYSFTFGVVPPMLRAGFAWLAFALLIPIQVPVGVWGLMALSLPVIPSLQFFLGYPLRLVTTYAAAGILKIQGFEIVPQGTGLYWAGETVWIDAPCSGIRMLWSGLYLAFTLSSVYRLHLSTFLRATLTAVLAILAGNAIRASLLFYPETRLLALPEWAHPAIGVVSFFITAIFVALATKVMIQRQRWFE
ncbi:exosortase/archaeosortase family protein [bacterium]|nr:exosortase/archaeosortase family protein [bacterium]